MAKENVNQIIKSLMPLVNQKLKALEAGHAVPGQKISLLDNPNFTGGLGLKSYTGGDTTPTPASYSHLSPGTISLLNSVRRLKSEIPEEHHTSLLGHIWNAVEKPYHAVTGAVMEQGKEVNSKDFKHSSIWDKLVKNAEAVGHGAKEGWQGKEKYTYSDIHKEALKQGANDPGWLKTATLRDEPLQNTKVGKFAANFIGDVALDPLSYTGAGALTKVRTLERTAEEIAKAQEVERTLESVGHKHASGAAETLLNPEIKQGRYYTKKQIGTSAEKTNTMRHARNITQAYGNIAFNRALHANRKVAEAELAKSGIREYNSLTAFKKFMKGDADTEDLIKWNSSVQEDIERRAGQLTGDRKTFVTGKAEDLLALASKTNFAGDAGKASEQLQKALGIKFAGKNVVKLTIPKSVVKGSERAVAYTPKGIREFSTAVHGHFNTAFRTGSHIEPLVNAMRMARHSAIVEKMNNVVRNGNEIWRGIPREERERAAKAISENQHNVVIEGGHDADVGKKVDNVVQWGIDKVKHIESLVGARESGRPITFEEFTAQLPVNFRIPAKFADSPNFLQEAWRLHYLGDEAKLQARHLYRFGKDPNVFLLAMQKAAFAAMIEHELPKQVVQRFGHQLYEVHPHTGKKISKANPITRVLVDHHGYRTPVEKPGSKVPIKGYEGAVFHDDVAKGIEAMHRMMRVESGRNKGNTNEATQLFEKATSMFKTVVTKFNPGFHERNLLGEMSSSFADGVRTIGPYRKSLQVLRLHGKLALDTGEALGTRRTIAGRITEDSRIHNALLPDAYKTARIAQVKGQDIVSRKRFRDLGSKGVTADQFWHAYVDNGLKTGWIATDTGKYAGSGGGRVGHAVNVKVQHLTENIEDYARLAHFISRIERSKLPDFEHAAEEAAAEVRKYHFDYNDFTQLEKATLSRIFPFYKWTRKNIPLQFALLFQKPGHFTTQMHGLQALSNAAGFSNNNGDVPTAEEVMPQWLRDHLAVPVGMGNSGVRYLDAPLPTTDAFKFFGDSPLQTEQSAAYMLNPAIKSAMEVATQHTVGGGPLQTNKYAAGQTPYSNFVYNLLNKENTGKSTNIAQFLLGLGLVENTPARIKGELKREQSALASQRKKYRAKHHMQPLGYSLP